VQGGRGGLRGLVRPSLGLMRRTWFALVSCARSGTDSWFWRRRGISLVQDLGIAMVGLSSFLGIIILVGWFIWIPLMRGSLILQGFCAYSVPKSRVAFDDQAGGYCCWLDAGNW
jgi:hypothetical protein